MPPKKASTAKATPAKSSAAATAASERPRRAAAKEATAPTPSKKAPAKRAPAKTTSTSANGKKRGRPTKAELAEEEEQAAAEPPKKRGRPAKASAATKEVPAVPEAETAPPKKRGRPPKGGETTQIAEDDPAAAEQLEEELVDAAEADEKEGPSKRAPPAKKGKGRGRPPKQKAKDDEGAAAIGAVDGVVNAAGAGDVTNQDEDVDEASSGKQQFWLMKAEQIDREETLQDGSVFNTKFTIDDLRAKAGPEPWDGVRNPTACKNMRAMKVGDLAFFYASGAKGKALQPGITGIMEVVKEHEPDMSAFDEKHPYYVTNPKQRGTKANPRWSMVHVEFRKKLSKPVALKELQQYKHASGVLANMQEFTAARLSVSKVTANEWNFIVDNLIDGYEDEAEDKQGSSLPTATTKSSDAAMLDVPAINGSVEQDQAHPTSETAAPSIEVNGTSRASSKKPSSRPTSRAPSRAASRASSKAPSHPPSQSKLAPPRAQSRGRSRTPASRANSVKPMQRVADEMETVEE